MDHINLLGSIVISGLLLLSVIGVFGDATDYGHQQTFELLTQETAASLVEILDHDLHRLGVGVDEPLFSVLAYDTSSFSFLGDVTEDGVADSVRYYLSLPGAATATPNPNDRVFFREVNGTPTIAEAFGVRSLEFYLLDQLGAGTTNPLEARAVEVRLRVESTIEYGGRYAVVLVRERVAPLAWIRPSHVDF